MSRICKNYSFNLCEVFIYSYIFLRFFQPRDLIEFSWEKEETKAIKHSTYDEYFAEFEKVRKQNNLESK